MTRDEAIARWICCPMCDKEKCERTAADCDVQIYLKKQKGGAGMTDTEITANLYALERRIYQLEQDMKHMAKVGDLVEVE